MRLAGWLSPFDRKEGAIIKSRTALVLVLTALMVFASTGAAWASSWVYVTWDKDLKADIFFDADTVAKNGSSLIFWELIVYDDSNLFGDLTELWKWEVKLTGPRYHRVLEYHAYDTDGRESYQSGRQLEFQVVPAGSLPDNEIDLTLGYGREGSFAGRPSVPAPR